MKSNEPVTPERLLAVLILFGARLNSKLLKIKGPGYVENPEIAYRESEQYRSETKILKTGFWAMVFFYAIAAGGIAEMPVLSALPWPFNILWFVFGTIGAMTWFFYRMTIHKVRPHQDVLNVLEEWIPLRNALLDEELIRRIMKNLFGKLLPAAEDHLIKGILDLNIEESTYETLKKSCSQHLVCIAAIMLRCNKAGKAKEGERKAAEKIFDDLLKTLCSRFPSLNLNGMKAHYIARAISELQV